MNTLALILKPGSLLSLAAGALFSGAFAFPKPLCYAAAILAALGVIAFRMFFANY